MFDLDSFQLVLNAPEYLSSVIYWLFLTLLFYKIYRFWTNKHLYADQDDKVFNPRIVCDINGTYEQGTLLTPYPNLWYPIIQSRYLRRGEVKPLYVLEKNLVVYRTMTGKAYVLDAFCAHLGAHLGVGGSVVGEDIRCPFHNRTYNGDGICTTIPGLNENVSKARVKSWKCVELNGWVFFWYHNKDQEPEWQPKVFEAIQHSYHTGELQCFIYGHLMELLGNLSDIDHFDVIHSMAGIISPEQVLRKGSVYQFMRKIFYFDYKVEWDHGHNENKYLAFTQSTITPVIFGRHIRSWAMLLETTLASPAFHITVTLTKLNIRFHLFTTMVPIAPLRIQCFHNVYHTNGILARLFARCALYGMAASLAPDQMIFNNKKYLANPHMTSLDTLQVKFIRWFKDNFYSD